ncbi:thioredoxin reductase (NADPH) [Agromyces flavus]|uniref:Thioredoxin reductase (NADPH) n=1 Tax=Agromyces flavus TaxID=589382 RepID=A0A1H1TM97_9MICO|nr:FAD-dependent oxidoreductase [Agromyces flavus]MCP2368393.1 thioredoxin reductase (NADPH) [Agromyces flavus]GGI47853.1 fused response regulator/thioredoxin-disulfide reductase [Agromyces flavus]SDS61445.1 thioredoxin reductase (NADPH) [Agromyces flavus]
MPTSAPPVILVVTRDDDARASIVAELARRYGADYRIDEALDERAAAARIHALAEAGGLLALVLSDRAGDIDRRSLFAVARREFPDVRRGRLIEWGQWGEPGVREEILRLMGAGELEYYVIRPWHSPDEYFHRTITEFLLEWERSIGLRPREVAVVGRDGLPRTHEIRSLLARGGVPHEWLDPDSDAARERLARSGITDTPTEPVVLLLDGRALRNPDNATLAAAYGLTTALDDARDADVVVVGAGPGGLAAAVYAASEGLDVLVVERESIGGQAGSSSLIRNYLGFARGISGSELAQRAYQQAWVFGARFAHAREVTGIERTEGGFVVRVAPGDEIRCRSVVLATGVAYRRIDVEELEPFEGAGVFYGASAVEAQGVSGKPVFVVGGGNSAGQAALHLARYASSVTLLVRGAGLAASMSQYLIAQLEAQGVVVRNNAEVVGGGGEEGLERILVRDRTTGEVAEEACRGLFVLIGASPRTDWLPPEVLRDRWGYVLTGPAVLDENGHRWPFERPPFPHETSVPGVFAVGDARRDSVKRVASAVGEGSVVVSAVHRHLANPDGKAVPVR